MHYEWNYNLSTWANAAARDTHNRKYGLGDYASRGPAVAEWTLDECSEYVALAWETYGETSAEAGMGAMSLGFGQEGAYAAAGAVPHPKSDPVFVEAEARLEAARKAAAPPTPVTPYDGDDIPF